ncbi:cobalamin biosynthesis protein [Mesorhizobium sp. 1B3]|uniref:cobalamin biosynthesis protein n=1 Tax=Mesorhizobium sp. 1B3 TaxID=3243599 RepID=UPI003D960975
MVVGKAMIVAGIGCRKDVGTEAVLAAIEEALSHHRLTVAELDAIATAPLKRDEPALHAAAFQLGLNLIVVAEEALRDAEADTLTSSQSSLDHAGSRSISEAAALAAAGPGSRLLGPRFAAGSVTCAIAVGAGFDPMRRRAP